MKMVLFDIDGTLADIQHRRAHLKKPKPNWARFNALMGDDTPNEAVVSLYKTLWASQNFKLVLVTGRNEQFRKVTEQWLTWHEIPFSKIYMRPDNDSRADHIIKEEILDKLLAQGAEIEFAVDDRNQVVNMWRRRGITCLQCDYGNF